MKREPKTHVLRSTPFRGYGTTMCGRRMVELRPSDELELIAVVPTCKACIRRIDSYKKEKRCVVCNEKAADKEIFWTCQGRVDDAKKCRAVVCSRACIDAHMKRAHTEVKK